MKNQKEINQSLPCNCVDGRIGCNKFRDVKSASDGIEHAYKRTHPSKVQYKQTQNRVEQLFLERRDRNICFIRKIIPIETLILKC